MTNWAEDINPMKDLCKTDRDIWIAAMASRIKMKEIRESFDFACRIRKFLKRKNSVLEVCCGHGLVSNILVEKGWVGYTYQIDIQETKGHERLLSVLNNSHRIFFYERNLYDLDFVKELDIDGIIGVHCCGSLTDLVIQIAILKNIDVAVVPCCYGKVKKDNRTKRIRGLFGDAGVDAIRSSRLLEQAYSVNLKKLNESITPMNNLIIGNHGI